MPADLERVAAEVMAPLLSSTLPRLLRFLRSYEGAPPSDSETARAVERATECAYMITKAYNRLTRAYLPVALGGGEGGVTLTNPGQDASLPLPPNPYAHR